MACGSEARAHVGLWLLGTSGQLGAFGDGLVLGLYDGGPHRDPEAGHWFEYTGFGVKMLYIVAGGWCKSRKRGTRKGRRWGLMLHAQTRRPRHRSRSLQETRLVCPMVFSCCANLLSLACARSMVSVLKPICYPHQRRLSPI